MNLIRLFKSFLVSFSIVFYATLQRIGISEWYHQLWQWTILSIVLLIWRES